METAKAKEEAILLSIGDGLIVTDKNQKILLINEKAERLLRLKHKAAVGAIFTEIIPVVEVHEVPVPLKSRPIYRALTTGTITTTTLTKGPAYYYVRNDKTKFPVAITVTPVKLSGKVIGAIEVFRDITKEKEVDKAKSEFVSLASHQLRTPLTAVSWYTELILGGDAGPISPKQKKYLGEIYQGNKRMIDLVNTLLDVSRIELGTLQFEAKTTDIAEITRAVLEDQKLDIANKNLNIISKFDKNVPTLFIDPNQLKMVVQNLITNSITYTSSGGKIELKISFDQTKRILIKVSDNGYGIPKDQQKKIFTKFFRADNAREKDSEGTGLGLYIVKSIVENFGGKIWFDSEENKGTTFYVELPLIGRVKT